MTKGKRSKSGFFNIVFMLFSAILLYSTTLGAQNWIALPPYNTLWPLWSPVLSPIDSHTCNPTPLVTELTPDTELDIIPGLTWDPSLAYPWLLYNTLTGLAYFDPFAGINLWPPLTLLNDHAKPSLIALPDDYANLPITDLEWLITNVPIANDDFILSYPSFLPTTEGPSQSSINLPLLSSLLTAIDILGPALYISTPLVPALPSIPLVNPVVILPSPTIPPATIPVQTIQVPSLIVPSLPVPTPILPSISIPIDPLLTPPIATAPAPLTPVVTVPIPAPPVPTPTIPVPTTPIPPAPTATILVGTTPLIPTPVSTLSVPPPSNPPATIVTATDTTIPIPIQQVPSLIAPTASIPTIPLSIVPTTTVPAPPVTIPLIPPYVNPIQTLSTIALPIAPVVPLYLPFLPFPTVTFPSIILPPGAFFPVL